MKEFEVTQALPKVFAVTLPANCPGIVTVTVTLDSNIITWDSDLITFDST
jgi:hypothetical protein